MTINKSCFVFQNEKAKLLAKATNTYLKIRIKGSLALHY